MPRGNGTGPLGEGPMTGRALGYCAGVSSPGTMNYLPGRGRGAGRGRRNRFWAGGPYRVGPNMPIPIAPVTREDQLKRLNEQADYFQQALNGIQSQIAALETGSDKK